MISNPSSKIPSNAMARPLMVCAIVNLCLVGLSVIIDFEFLSSLAIYWLPPICFMLLIGYTVMAIRLGWVATVGHLGQIFHFQRAKQPVPFWFLVGIYLTFSIPATSYWLLRVLSGP